MPEDVNILAALLGDEAEALLRVVPLHSTAWHGFTCFRLNLTYGNVFRPGPICATRDVPAYWHPAVPPTRFPSEPTASHPKRPGRRTDDVALAAKPARHDPVCFGGD